MEVDKRGACALAARLAGSWLHGKSRYMATTVWLNSFNPAKCAALSRNKAVG